MYQYTVQSPFTVYDVTYYRGRRIDLPGVVSDYN